MSVRASHLLVKHAVATRTALSTRSTIYTTALQPFLPCLVRERASSAHKARVVLGVVRESTGRIVGSDSVLARSPVSSPAHRARVIVCDLCVAHYATIISQGSRIDQSRIVSQGSRRPASWKDEAGSIIGKRTKEQVRRGVHSCACELFRGGVCTEGRPGESHDC